MAPGWPTCPWCYERCRAEMTRNFFYCDKPHGTLGPYEISGMDAYEELARRSLGGGAAKERED